MAQQPSVDLEVLKKKAMLLLRREREVFQFRQERARAESWLDVFHALSLELQTQDQHALLDRWTKLLVNGMGFQVAGAYRHDPAEERLVLECAAPPSRLSAGVSIDVGARAFLEANPGARYQPPDAPAQLERLAGDLRLQKFHWLRLNLDGQGFLLLAGFSSEAAPFNALAAADQAQFVMLGNHLGALLNSMWLLASLRRERTEFQRSNEELEAATTRTRAEMEERLALEETVRQELPEGELRTFAQEIERAGQRAAALTRQLLGFSRKQFPHPQALDIQALVGELIRMIRRLIGEHVELRLQVRGSVGHALIDPSQLEQILVNLAVNTRDAMPGGGELVVELRDVEVPASGAPGQAGLAPGAYVRIQVSDTGLGMDPATLGRIFEPFFTTKEKGKGTGLGLAMVYGAVKQNGGAIDVVSAPGAGSTFTIHLPRVAAPAAMPAESVSEAPRGHGEQILVVEDEPQLRTTVIHLLSSAGYRVMEAEHGEQGLATFAAHQDGIDLVLTDLMMPCLDGFALGRAIRERSAVPVLYMSGYSEEVASGKERIRPELFLQKPFDRGTLLRRVRSVLAVGSGGELPPP
jgi:signal transduction histidine kinase